MTEREPPRRAATARVLRSRTRGPSIPPPAVRSTTDAAPPQVRAPNRTAWPGPLNAEDRAALEAGWGFVE
ncbi:hypothetical protein FOHLNKBM_3306 [Methylobacterium longum]|jgi:hypothetical protein|nr:hypothetical protein FOHLNKBM_3306 [Methylobacterium longum]